MMQDKYEIEYSFICTVRETIDKLRSEYTCTNINYEISDIYYDTNDRILSKNKYVLREREQKNETIFTLKGPTTGTNPPKRLEIEDNDKFKILRELYNRLPESQQQNLIPIQERHTQREEYDVIGPGYGFTICIDTTKFDNGARYVNIEIEAIANENSIQALNSMKSKLLQMKGIREWKPSKFQVGEAVKALGMTGDLRTVEDFHKIEIYLGNKEKREKL